jgi:hypothetical protein
VPRADAEEDMLKRPAEHTRMFCLRHPPLTHLSSLLVGEQRVGARGREHDGPPADRPMTFSTQAGPHRTPVGSGRFTHFRGASA